MGGSSKRENRETSVASQRSFFDLWERSENVSDDTADMHATGESDESVVAAKLTNNGGTEPLAESVEGRDSAKGNVEQTASLRIQGRSIIRGWSNSWNTESETIAFFG